MPADLADDVDDASRLVRLSKVLSFVLRHRPDSIGLALDAQGWADVDALLDGLGRSGRGLDRATLARVVAGNDKARFELSADGRRIRARQGHSVPVDLALPDAEPPAVLYHGTASRFVSSILREGLRPRGRHAVHLSADVDTARRVGARHGVPVVLAVDAARMRDDGHRFQRTANGVWLTPGVPARYLGRVDRG